MDIGSYNAARSASTRASLPNRKTTQDANKVLQLIGQTSLYYRAACREKARGSPGLARPVRRVLPSSTLEV